MIWKQYFANREIKYFLEKPDETIVSNGDYQKIVSGVEHGKISMLVRCVVTKLKTGIFGNYIAGFWLENTWYIFIGFIGFGDLWD